MKRVDGIIGLSSAFTLLFAALFLFSCKTPAPPVRHLAKVGVCPQPLLTSSASGGNNYLITASVYTQAIGHIPIPMRVVIQLSVDGGSTYNTTIAYGLPVVTNTVSYTYSMPWWNTALLTEHAMVRITDLEGNLVGQSQAPFTIAGVSWITPAAGTAIAVPSYISLQWTQAGVKGTAQLGYITPTNSFTPLVTISNLVAGVNSYTWFNSNFPKPTPQFRLVLRSVSDPKVWGATGVLSTQ